MGSLFAPGQRVEIRDAEWRIRSVDYASDGGYVLVCEGLSQLVQGREALFLSNLERPRILAPEDTMLVDDASGNFGASLLYIDSLLRKTAPSDERRPRKAKPADLKEGTRYAIHSDTRTETDIALGWEDIKDLPTGTVSKTYMDDTLPGGPTERTIQYQAPFFKPDREQDYRVAWAYFEKEKH